MTTPITAAHAVSLVEKGMIFEFHRDLDYRGVIANIDISGAYLCVSVDQMTFKRKNEVKYTPSPQYTCYQKFVWLLQDVLITQDDGTIRISEPGTSEGVIFLAS